jgi:formylglycine-generating enzyme required for sulfatase activity
MGSVDGDRDERPVREVSVRDFSLGRSEVTVGWYLRCMADSACEVPSWWNQGYFEEEGPATLSRAERMRLPVTGISWRQAKDFCRWLGPGYDLPTEAEWEYAAGAGRNWKYPWGNDPQDRYKETGPQRHLTPAGSYPAGPLGLFDVGGGVWEWVDDCYKWESRSGSKGESKAASAGEGARTVEKTCATRVTKGGSWSDHTWNLRVANKSFGLESEGYKGLGFRVVYHAP